ncbi:protein GAMETE CELL DEFECTIVE 1, mitochondrial-like [Miscanthus floridulus]|uniref:protein GAMETE CELL DEFECTIVE 1, mitochondrial-like n=1 Tax=Miscanthus floridulus TaxID=154761 RepID=UPI003458A830
MHSLRRALRRPIPNTAASLSTSGLRRLSSHRRTPPPPRPAATGNDEWNDAWETAWLPGDSPASSPAPAAPWESPASASASASSVPAIAAEVDPDTKAFVADMDERWAERRAASRRGQPQRASRAAEGGEGGAAARKKAQADDYRTRKQRVHAALWVKEIEKMEEARLGGGGGGADDIDRLLDSCSDIFDSGNTDFGDSKIPSTTEIKTKPDGWETTSRGQDGNIWDISQREDDILLQEFERRIAFSKQQIASFIKTHIFSRRRPIDGWKYMIEEIGPNARKGKGSVQRLPSVSDPATQPYREETPAIASSSSFRGNRP